MSRSKFPAMQSPPLHALQSVQIALHWDVLISMELFTCLCLIECHTFVALWHGALVPNLNISFFKKLFLVPARCAS